MNSLIKLKADYVYLFLYLLISTNAWPHNHYRMSANVNSSPYSAHYEGASWEVSNHLRLKLHSGQQMKRSVYYYPSKNKEICTILHWPCLSNFYFFAHWEGRTGALIPNQLGLNLLIKSNYF